MSSATQGGNEPVRPVAISDDDISIGEIRPAMLAKLKADGKIIGILLGLVIAAMVYWAWPVGVAALVQEQLRLDYFEMRLATDLYTGLGGLSILLLPLLTPYWNVRREVRYRRLHGKWRWER
ncbi:MAG TPA: hypothetical protein VMT54_12600 [Candidatus Cybelea sp.]|nr:hypothetical protein [Candidatus Cybelea sp.]